MPAGAQARRRFHPTRSGAVAAGAALARFEGGGSAGGAIRGGHRGESADPGRRDGRVADETIRSGPIQGGPNRGAVICSAMIGDGVPAGSLASIAPLAGSAMDAAAVAAGARVPVGAALDASRVLRAMPAAGPGSAALRGHGDGPVLIAAARVVDVHGSCRESTGGQASRRDADRRRNTAPRPSVGRGDLEGVLVRRGFGPGSVSRVKRISGAHRVALPASVRWTEAGSRFYRQNRRSASRA